MRAAIRTDASSTIGSGHLVRCLTLAAALRDRGTEVRFVTREHDRPTATRIRDAGFEVVSLPSVTARTDVEVADYDAWLGVTQERDAEETLARIGESGVDLLVVDHYGIDEVWESRLADSANRILVIDDLANRPHSADVLIDQNLRPDGAGAYGGLVPSTGRVLSGPSYALIRDEYVRARRPAIDAATSQRVLVSLGGSDDLDLIATIMPGLAALGSLISSTDLVVADPDGVRQRLGADLSGRDVHVHGPVPHLADLMSRSGLVIGAGGGTTWERLCVGLPSLVVIRAENQRPGTQQLAWLGAVVDLGNASELSAARVAEQTRELLRSPERCRAMHDLGQALVDGRGPQRILEALTPTSTERLSLRQASSADRGLLWMWANDRSVRDRSHNPSAITWEEHLDWFARTYGADDVRLLILEADGLPVGQLRFDLQDGQAVINYSLDACVRGRGWGREIIDRGIRWLHDRVAGAPLELVAIVRADNQASIRVFERLGFSRGTSIVDGDTTYRFTRHLAR